MVGGCINTEPKRRRTENGGVFKSESRTHPLRSPADMAKRSCSCIFYAAAFLWAFLLGPAVCSAKKHNTLFVFGDSLFDPGNNQYVNATPGGGAGMATSLPYGETYFKHATGRLSDGRLVPDFIGTENRNTSHHTNRSLLVLLGLGQCPVHLGK